MFNLVPSKKRYKEVLSDYEKQRKTFFDRFPDIGFFPGKPDSQGRSFFPTLDISEGKKDIKIKAEIPGVDSKDIQVSVDGRFLTIEGEKKQEKEEKNDAYHRVERSYGFYQRTVELPSDVDPDDVEATYKKGVLKIRLKKTRDSEIKRIKVKAD